MKTITHYFTSPKEDSESPVDRSLSRNKKQASVKVLFEKTSCSGKNQNKPIVKCSNEDEVKPTKRKNLPSRKKLKFDLEKFNSHEPCDDSDDNSTNVKQINECIEKKMGKATKCPSVSKKNTLKKQIVENIKDSELNSSLKLFDTNKIKKKIKTSLSDKECKSDQNLKIKNCSNDNDINKVIETKKYKQNNKLNFNKKSSNNVITISKSTKRKSTNEAVSFTSKKKKSENEQINTNHSKNLDSNHKNDIENNTTDRDTSRPEISDKHNDSKIRNSKTTRKSSLQTKLSEKIVEKSTSLKLPLQDMSSPIISEKQNEPKSSSLKSKRKSSLHSKLPKKIVEKSILSEQPLILKKSNNKSIEDNNDLKGTKNCHSDSELNSSLEIFDTNKIQKKIKTTFSDKEYKSDQNLDNSKVSPSDKSQGNSLFSYFNKVDKEMAMTRQQHNKIKVEALIHSPPKIEPKRSKCRNSLDKLSSISKSSGLKTKALMKASDKIDVLSSEVINLDECLNNSITEVSNDLSVCVNDDIITPKKKTSAIENYFKVDTIHKTPVACKTPEDNVKKISVSASKSWTMRVRLTPTSKPTLVDSNTQSQLEDLSIEENTFSSGHKMLDDGSDMSSYSNSQSSNEKSNEKIEKTYTTIKAEKSSTSVRMYSLFGKEEKPTKTVLDPVKLEAKVKFLESGAPESIKRKVDSFRSESIVGSPAQFPIVTHVQQRETDNDVWNLCKPVSNLPLAPPLSQWEGVLLSSFSLTNESCTLPQSIMLRPPENIKAYLKELSNQEPDMAVNAVYKSLRNKKKRFGNSSEVWTEIYKPEMVSEIIGNTENINKLKSWLQVQKNIRKREGSISSGDEFIESDSGGEDKPCMNNMAILAGPYGCGKTCAVYAIANELDCEVLEINSSCNRTGKRLLAEFSESTQSHNVDSSQSMPSLFSPSSSIKLKKKKKLRTDSIETRPTHLGKTSLLLVEDADILFPNHDEGFVSAIASLISTSKRPVILTVNDQKCVHLTKFESVNQLQLTFNKPRSSKLALWLRIVALVEGVQLSADQSQSLVEWSNGDVRRSLLQLQLIMQSKMSQTINERSLTSLWWNWPAKYSMKFQLPTLLVNDFLEEENVEMVDKEKNKSDIKSIAKLTDTLASIDMLSPIHQKCRLNDPCPKPWQITQVDATCLSEQDVQLDFEKTLNFDFSNWLVRTVILENEEHLPLRYSTSSEKRWSSLLKKANNLFLPGVSLSQHCCHHAVTSDYFPALRTLGRAEQLRLATYTKRANRYFSYLKGLGIHANKSFKDLMCDCFSKECL